MPTRYNGIHKHRLFHWIGRHIDYPGGGTIERRPRLKDEQRREYLACLRGILAPRKGLWVKPPGEPDRLGDGALVKVDRPIVCFTEWSLDESLPHTMRYGRLGLGFPKQFVLRHGGQPVTYVRDRVRGDPFTRAMMVLARHLHGEGDREEDKHVREAFAYVSQFLKRIDRAEPSRLHRRRVHRRPPSARPPVRDPFRRSFGRTLEYLEEREWRIVFEEKIAEGWNRGRKEPPYYLPIRPGFELFTVVLPDNRTVNLALGDRRLRDALFPKNAPHVTILSLEDIGTF
jgi:hypothetical protein